MSLQCTCQRCGDTRPLDEVILAAIDDAAFQQAIQAAASLPPTHADAAIRYMRLFGNLRPPAYAKLLRDLAEAISTGQFVQKRQPYKASQALWLAALTDTLASTTIRLPLKAANGHGFLFAIAAAKADQAAEQRREHPTRLPVINPAQPAPDRRRQELLTDIAHWENQAKLAPNDPTIASILETSRAKLAAEFPTV